MEKTEAVKLVFIIACYLATAILLANNFLIYYKNKDVSEILYKEYNEDSQTPYLSLTLCFKMTPSLIKTEALKKYGIETNGSSYEDFLKGNYWDEKMLNISYEQVTQPLENYVIDAITKEAFGHGVSPMVIKRINVTTLPSYLNIYKCLTFDMPNLPDQKIKLASITLSNSIFFNGILPGTYDLVSNLHLPGEMLGNALGTKWTWNTRKNVSNVLQQRFTVKSMTLFRRRNKIQDVCHEYKDFDRDYREAIIAKVGCIPPYWISSQIFEKCKSARELQMIARYAFKGYSGSPGLKRLFPKPCLELKKLSFNDYDADLELKQIETKTPDLISKKYGKENVTNFLVIFEDNGIKEIIQVRAFGIASLVGNIGGYIGLFLGFSIIQFPSFCVFLNEKLGAWSIRNGKSGGRLSPTESSTTELKVQQKDKLQSTTLHKRVELLEEKLKSFYVKSNETSVFSLAQ